VALHVLNISMNFEVYAAFQSEVIMSLVSEYDVALVTLNFQ